MLPKQKKQLKKDEQGGGEGQVGVSRSTYTYKYTEGLF